MKGFSEVRVLQWIDFCGLIRTGALLSEEGVCTVDGTTLPTGDSHDSLARASWVRRSGPEPGHPGGRPLRLWRAATSRSGVRTRFRDPSETCPGTLDDRDVVLDHG